MQIATPIWRNGWFHGGSNRGRKGGIRSEACKQEVRQVRLDEAGVAEGNRGRLGGGGRVGPEDRGE